MLDGANPYYDIVAKLPRIDGVVRRFPSVREILLRGAAYDPRERLKRQYAWAIPTPAAIAALVRYSPLIEIGAGNGYWAWCAQQAGADVVAYDTAPSPDENYWTDGRWMEVRRGGVSVLRRRATGRTLFLCWPPYTHPMAARALQLYRGQRLIYVGEEEGGCNATDAFFQRLAREWHEVEEVEILRWEGLHDRMLVYERGATS